MKNYLLLFALLGLTLFGCKDDDEVVAEDYNVTISVEQPTTNAIVNVDEAMAITVNYERTGEDNIIHHVKIVVLDDAGNVVEEIFTEHAHQEGVFVYEDVAAYTPTTTGNFILKAMSHDFNDTHTTPVEVPFTVN